MSQSIQTISAENFCKSCIENQHTLVIDVRTPAEVRGQYIENSVNLPLDELNAEKFTQLVESRSKQTNQTIFLLCQGGHRAKIAAEKLTANVSNPLVIIEGGIQALSIAGLDVHSSNKQNISLERQVRIAAGTLVLIGLGSGSLIHSGFYVLAAFVGAGLIYAGISNTCGMALILSRMPWNK